MPSPMIMKDAVSSLLIVGLLNLPKNDKDGNFISINGLGFRTSNDLVVITGVPETGIHWIVWNQKQAFCCTQNHLVLSYDPSTEEMVVADSVTFDNFIQNRESWAMRSGVVHYDTLLLQQQQQQQQQQHPLRPSSRYIDSRLLHLRGISHGTKIVPGTYREDNDPVLPAEDKTMMYPSPRPLDGIEMDYPAIPVFTTKAHSDNRPIMIRHISHGGTKSFLRTLSPAERTQFFLSDDNPNLLALDRILSASYENSMTLLLADLDLSFFLLLSIHCYSSWNHWRNLTVLLLRAHSPEVCPIILEHLPSIESELLYDGDDDSDGVFIKSLREYKAPNPSTWKSTIHKWLPRIVDDDADPDDLTPLSQTKDEEDDPPMIVQNVPENLPPLIASVQDPWIRQTYPILTAAVLETEDILMTCARALDEAKDVSLVREAAAYLEEVEAFK